MKILSSALLILCGGFVCPFDLCSMPLSPYEPDSSTVVLFHCDELSGTQVENSSHNNLMGSLAAGEWSTSGRFQGGLLFTGNGYISVLGAPLGTPDATYEAFVYRTSNVSCMIVDTIAPTLPIGDGRSLGINESGRVYAQAVASHLISVTSVGTTQIPLNEWVHIAAVFNERQGVVQVLVNGVMEASTALPGGLWGSGDLRIAHSLRGSCCGFQGIIDEIRISNVARHFGGDVPVRNISWGLLKASPHRSLPRR